jgi:hypothetical protein
MKAKCLVVVVILSALFSCHKEKDRSPDNPPSFVALKLKDINIRSLPSPYYHFEYKDDKQISSFNFSSGLMIYEMTYTGDDLTRMRNTTFGGNRDSVQYNYTNGKLISIHVTTDAGELYRKASFTYYADGRLQKLEWELRLANEPFAKEQSFTFTYYPDGNVKEITQHYFPVGPQPDVTFVDKYENYDNKKNVDGFSLVHTSQFKHPVLMPGITLQVNNAGRVVRTGDAAVTYEINYTYTYDNTGRPLVKTGDFVFTSGQNTGHHTELQTTYAYYD